MAKKYTTHLCSFDEPEEKWKKPHSECPNVEDHTPCPTGYVAWHNWAEKMGKTHKSTKCSGCNRYAIWVLKLRCQTCQRLVVQIEGSERYRHKKLDVYDHDAVVAGIRTI